MRKMLSVLICCALIFGAVPFEVFTVAAADIVSSGSCGENVRYTLDSDGLLTISGTGTMADYGWGMKNATSPFFSNKSIKKIVVKKGVKSIGENIFYNCSELLSLTLSDSIESISEFALRGCEKLTSLSIPDNVTAIYDGAFEGCSGLTNVKLPNKITTISDDLFLDCTGLTSVTIPNSVTSIGNSAFRGCTVLKSVKLPNKITSISDSLFCGCTGLTNIFIPDGVTSIGRSAFRDCTGLTNVIIPDSVTSIGDSAFSGCSGFTGVDIPDSVTSIDDYAFYGCSGLTSLTIPNSVTSINDHVFYGCSGLTSLNIPNSVTSIDSYAFCRCTGLTGLTIPDNVTSIYDGAFSRCSGLETIEVSDGNEKYHSAGNCLIETASKKLSLGCKNSIIPDDGSITQIGNGAFCGCTGLTGVDIPDSVTSIGSYAFCGCTGLTSVTIPHGVTSIGYCAFSECTGLTSIIIPPSVTEIRQYAIPEHTLIIGAVGSYAQQWAEEKGIAFMPMESAYITLNYPEVVNTETVDVWGLASPGATVVISVNDKQVQAVKAAANGKWNAAVRLEGVKDGDAVTIKASVTVGGKKAEESAEVKYLPDAVLTEEFHLSHSYYSYSVTDKTLYMPSRNFTFVPGKPCSFKIKVTNNDRIDKLYIVSTKNGDSKQMELTRSADGYWLVNGFFDPDDTSYVPGEFTVKGVDKAGAEFDTGTMISLNFLVDPSGYAYEAVKSNVLEGVTARVIYKDAEGHEILWNAEEADQLNPVMTLADGAFAWVVPEGTWQVRLSMSGYEDAASEWMEVPPEHTNVYIPMISNAAPKVESVDVFAERAVITFTQYMDITYVNTDNVKFDGYNGRIAAIDKTETEKGSGVFYAKSFSFTPDRAFTGEVKATVVNAANYAGEALYPAYSGTFTVAAEPANLTAPAFVLVKYGETKEIEITADNATGRTVTVSADSAITELSANSVTLDKNGKATISVKAIMPGEAKLTITLAGTTLTAGTSVKARISDEEAIPGDVDGNGQVLANDARLALRASAKLETLDEIQTKAADVDGSGDVLANDARQILRFSAKLQHEFVKK